MRFYTILLLFLVVFAISNGVMVRITDRKPVWVNSKPETVSKPKTVLSSEEQIIPLSDDKESKNTSDDPPKQEPAIDISSIPKKRGPYEFSGMFFPSISQCRPIFITTPSIYLFSV